MSQPVLKIQAVNFQRKQNGNWETGIAYLKHFGLSDIQFIVDIDGKKLEDEEVFDYRLISEPFSCLQVQVTIESRRSYTITSQ